MILKQLPCASNSLVLLLGNWSPQVLWILNNAEKRTGIYYINGGCANKLWDGPHLVEAYVNFIIYVFGGYISLDGLLSLNICEYKCSNKNLHILADNCNTHLQVYDFWESWCSADSISSIRVSIITCWIIADDMIAVTYFQ